MYLTLESFKVFFKNKQNNPENIKIVKASPLYKKQIENVLWKSFQGHMPKNELNAYVFMVTNLNKSYVALNEQGNVIGAMLLGDNQVTDFMKKGTKDYKKYSKLKGIEGVALCVDLKYRNQRIGDKLRRLPLTLDYDYIWGQQLKSLNNINNWIKFGRRIVYENDSLYVTLMDLK